MVIFFTVNYPAVDALRISNHLLKKDKQAGEKQSNSFISLVKKLYGGLIVENIVQAICRDLVAEGMKAVTKAGYEIIMHSHDELISEAPEGFGTIEEYERLMCSVPSWAKGFPVKAEGWVGQRYKK